MLSPTIATRVSWFLLLIIIYILALFSWSLWDYIQPRQTIDINALANSNSTKQSSTLNIRQLTAFNLFGDTAATTNTTDNSQIDAPVTRLKLKLRGVYSASEEDLAGAMIEAQNKQEVYRLGSKLPGAAGLKLHKIMSDRVIMSRDGKFETLLIEDFGSKNSSGRSSRSTSRAKTSFRNTDISDSTSTNTIDKRNDDKLTRELVKLRENISDPQSLNKLLAVTPSLNDEDEFQGFRLSPGQNRALFGRLGLRNNDVLVMVNGISLDDPSSALSLMEQIRTADEIDLKIKRGGKSMNILFSARSQ